MNPRTLDTSGPFLRQDGLRAGLTKHVLDGPRFQSVFGAVRLPAERALDLPMLARSAHLLVPRSVVSHQTAARLWGAVVPTDADTHVTVRHSKERRSRPGLRCHVHRSTVSRVVDGIAITTPEQTFCHLAEELSLVDAVVLGESLIQCALTTADRLAGFAERVSNVHRRAVLRAAGLVRDGVESPMESRTRLLLVLAGLPEPLINVVVGGRGTPTYRLDLAWPELKLAVEYDGRHHAEDRSQWGRDLARREWLDGRGWRLVVLRSDDIYVTPWATARRVAEALAARGFETDALLRGPSLEFRANFPGRPERRPHAS